MSYRSTPFHAFITMTLHHPALCDPVMDDGTGRVPGCSIMDIVNVQLSAALWMGKSPSSYSIPPSKLTANAHRH